MSVVPPPTASLAEVAAYMAAPGKGILASDESTGTIGKRLEKVGITNDEVGVPALLLLLPHSGSCMDRTLSCSTVLCSLHLCTAHTIPISSTCAQTAVKAVLMCWDPPTGRSEGIQGASVHSTYWRGGCEWCNHV